VTLFFRNVTLWQPPFSKFLKGFGGKAVDHIITWMLVAGYMILVLAHLLEIME
jgi:hypothetical protein